MKLKKLTICLSMLSISTAVLAQNKTESEHEQPVSTIRSYKSMLTISPIQFTENGVGFSAGFEHIIDAEGIVAYQLPVIATFNLAKSDIQYGNKQDGMFYFMPGIKFYPTGAYGQVKYAVGPSIMFGAGQQTDDVYDPYNVNQRNYVTKDKMLLGAMINSSLNIVPTPQFYMGLDFGFGFSYLCRIDGINQGTKGLVQGGFKLGYRFK